MPRCKVVVPNEERRPAVVKRTEWASPEEEAVMVSRVEEPARGLHRFWIILITGGMFHVFLAYSLIGCLFSEFVLGWPWYMSLGAFLAAYITYVSIAATERVGAPDPHIRGQQAMATLRDYLSLKCVIPDDVDLDPKPEQQPPSYIFGSHPHGIHAFGCSALNFAGNDMARYFPRVWHRLTGAIASVIFRVPIVREVMLAHGYRDASRAVCEKILREGRSVVLVLGGEQESIRTRGGEDAVWLKNRKGFVRLAMREGASLVPTYSFGLVDIYDYAFPLQALRMWMVNTLRVCVPIFWGVAGTPCPYERPVTTVVGAPIHVEWTLHPHPALVEDAYCRYVDALERLYETHKAAAGYPADRNLHVTRDPPASKETLAKEAAAFRARLIHKLGPEDGRITFADAEQRARDALGEDAVPAPAEPKKER
ncbi:hypothetical protein FNF29_07847 [Cafeteria roenbergensis]|uniref:Acyltransferase n=3 Tax=Cafeteria roenbergensis TaxID=33653 RepID=A0A5A8CH62_CAFRO|nr:hypothetical protein FNF29_08343 [Cafeteria roenbergensis]KAA0146785.1 hypothetical protein FNF29_07847 [Cafeteria roenbergensis]KAA0151181.1 hypothetical protein FNF31_06871 [Cafeteria roenbergensis]|eukprot:KAA0145914.1 hypothetical protein FNF29_08343 [Cafeteria roenbergensis]